MNDTINRILEAAKQSKNYQAFERDMKKCEIAYGTCGLYQIKAEVWIELLGEMESNAIYSYVENKYAPGALDPFNPST